MTGVQQVSARVEELLDALKAGGFGGAAPAAEELVALLVGLYGDGLARVMAVLAEQGPPGDGDDSQARRRSAGGEPAAAARSAPARRGRQDPARTRPGRGPTWARTLAAWSTSASLTGSRG